MANNFFSTVDPLYGLENIPGVLNLPGAENYLTGQQFGGGVEGLIKGINASQNLDPVFGTINTLANAVYGVKKGGETGMSNLSTMQKLRQDLIKSGIDITKGGIDIQKGRFDLQKAPFELANIAYQASQGQFDANSRNNLMNLIKSLPVEQQLQALADPKTWYTKTLEANMPTTDIKEYERSLKDPNLKQYLLDVNRSRAQNIDLGTKAREQEQIEGIKYFNKVQQDVNANIPSQNELTLAATLSENAGSAQGLGADALTLVDNFAERFGIKTSNRTAQDNLRVLKSVQIKLALGEKKPGTGPMTDKDFENFLNTTLKTTNTQAANAIIAFVAQERYKMQQDFADDFAMEVSDNGYGPNVYTFERKWYQKNSPERMKYIKSQIRKISDEYANPGADSEVLDIIDKPLIIPKLKSSDIPDDKDF